MADLPAWSSAYDMYHVDMYKLQGRLAQRGHRQAMDYVVQVAARSCHATTRQSCWLTSRLATRSLLQDVSPTKAALRTIVILTISFGGPNHPRQTGTMYWAALTLVWAALMLVHCPSALECSFVSEHRTTLELFLVSGRPVCSARRALSPPPGKRKTLLMIEAADAPFGQTLLM